MVLESSYVQSNTVPSSSQSQVSQSSNNNNKDLLQPNIPINLPEGPPTRPPLPIEIGLTTLIVLTAAFHSILFNFQSVKLLSRTIPLPGSANQHLTRL